jgi:hypothetical protein
MIEIQSEILDRAFAGEWITLNEIRVFGEESDKESGKSDEDDNNSERFKGGLIGGVLGGSVGGTFGSTVGGPEGAIIGGLAGGVAGATLGVKFGGNPRRFRAVFVDINGKVDSRMCIMVSKEQVIEKVKIEFQSSSQIKAFKYPEEEKQAGIYIEELKKKTKRTPPYR